jgi:hypothetical protein
MELGLGRDGTGGVMVTINSWVNMNKLVVDPKADAEQRQRREQLQSVASQAKPKKEKPQLSPRSFRLALLYSRGRV